MATLTYNPKSNKELRKNARGQLIGKYSIAIFVSLFVAMITAIITSITDSTYTGSLSNYLMRFTISIVVDLLCGIFIYGQSKFFLALVRGEEPLTASDLFYGFKNNMDKAIIIQSVFTLASFISSAPALLVNLGVIPFASDSYASMLTLVTVLTVVLTISAKLFFGLSFYVLADNPDMTAGEVFRESMRLMENRKGRYITLCLSLIPVMIVSVCAFVVGCFWFVAYNQTIMANFYLDAIGEEPFNPTVEREPIREEYSDNPFA